MPEGGRFISVSNVTQSPPPIDFGRIQRGVNIETAAMLPVTVPSLEQSFANGLSTIVMDTTTDTPVGHIRFSPLFTPELRTHLNLPSDLPDLWEIGTGWIDGSDHFRSQGLYRMVRNDHISRYQDELNEGNLISIGTTKSLKVLHTLHHAQEEFGVEGIILPHTNMPFIAAFTCICTGNFGCGFQNGVDACPQRIKPEQFPGDGAPNTFIDHTDLEAITKIQDLNGGSGKIPCTMYLQGKKSAIMNLELRLQEQFGTPENLIEQLKQPAVNYYNENIN